jgi:acetylornithine deacetylase
MKALTYAEKLIKFESTSQLSNQLPAAYIEQKLKNYGFITERLSYLDANGVRKYSVIGKKGTGHGGLAYFSHSDTVPVANWFSKKFGPYQPAIARDRLYGRGACDMKGSIACMLEAQQAFSPDDLREPFYFVCTADEEVGYLGAKQVVAESKFYREMVAAGTKGIIGEPTMLDVVHAHKGVCSLTAIARGKTGHSGSRDTLNPNLAMIPYLNEMKLIYDETQQNAKWHNGEFDPPTVCWNIGINDHTAALNVVPAESVCTVFLRPMPGQPIDELIERCRKAAAACSLEFSVDRHSGPVYTDPRSDFVKTALELARRKETKTVSYGTDGGVLTELENLIVFGPGNIAQAHTSEEWIAIEQLSLGVEMYIKFIRQFCVG